RKSIGMPVASKTCSRARFSRSSTSRRARGSAAGDGTGGASSGPLSERGGRAGGMGVAAGTGEAPDGEERQGTRNGGRNARRRLYTLPCPSVLQTFPAMSRLLALLVALLPFASAAAQPGPDTTAYVLALH